MFVMSRHCNKSIIIKAVAGTFAFMSQIILSAFGIDNQLANSFLAIIALYFLVSQGTATTTWLGFFIGIFAFYWIGFSFYYLELGYLIPVVIISIGVVYGLIFYIFAKISSYAGIYFPLARAVLAAYYFDIMSPFGFNWFKLELFLSDTFFGITKLHLFAILFLLAILVVVKNPRRYGAILLLLFCIHSDAELKMPDIKINIANTYIKFDDKYEKENIFKNIEIIDEAIYKGYDLVVLPETAFAHPLNISPEVASELLQRSKKIAILCGSIRVQGKNFYNSNYLFQNGKVQTFDKVIGVPFGEVNPLPKFMSDFVNEIFFGGADDFKTAKDFSDFEIKGVKFRNAICYEATKDEAYEKRPKYMMALSNNSWFMPSLEPILQKKLIKYYSRLNKTVVFHCVNMSSSYVVR
jgi:apolipoprotein N-acyltransferase